MDKPADILEYFLLFKSNKLIENSNLPGIYVIYQVNTKEAYIGESVSLGERLKQHRTKLIKNNHPNLVLQNAFNSHGLHNFSFLVYHSDLLAHGFFRKEIETFIIQNWPYPVFNNYKIL